MELSKQQKVIDRKFAYNTGKLPGFQTGFIPPSYEEIFGPKKDPMDLNGDGRVFPWEQWKYNRYLDDSKYTSQRDKIAPITYKSELDKSIEPKPGPMWDSGTKELLTNKKPIWKEGMLQTGTDFLGSIYNSFANNSDSVDAIRNQYKTQDATAGGIGYQKKVTDYRQIADENHSKNMGNVANAATKGAALGMSTGNPIIGAAGFLAGGLIGGIGAAFGAEKEAAALAKAQAMDSNDNNAAADYAMGESIRHKNAREYGTQTGQLLYQANAGKSENLNIYGFTQLPKILHTINGIEVGNANAKVEPGEGVSKVLPDGTVQFNRYNDGKIRNKRPGDILYTYTTPDETIWTNNKDPYTGVRFSDEAEARVKAGLPLDDLQLRMAEQQAAKKSGKITKAKCGKLPGHAEGWLGNAIPAAIGGLAGFGQFMHAANNVPYRPNTYVSNPYESEALTTLAGLRVNPYPIMNQLRSAEARTNRAIDIAGGLSGGQRTAARLAALNTTQGNISKLLSDIQQQNNAYRANYAQAAINAGQQARTARMAANQWDLDYYSKAHAARNKGIQTGIANMLAQIQQYQANEFKRRQFNETMDLYRADQKQRNEQNQWMRNWYDRTKAVGAELIGEEGFMVNEAPSDDDLAKLKELAAQLA